MTTTANFTGGPGTFTIVDDTALAIREQTTAQQALLNSIILQIGSDEIPGTVIGVMSGTQGTLSIISKKLQQIDDNLKKLNVQMTSLTGKMEQTKTGLAEMSTHMSQQSVIQKLSYIDQTKHNEFQQLTTNASLADAGKPPTIVTPAAFVTKVQSTLQDLTMINAQTTVVSTLTSYSTEAVTYGYTKSLEWAAKTEIGQWITTTYGEIKLKVTALFSAEKAKEVLDDSKQALLDVKGGNPTTLG